MSVEHKRPLLAFIIVALVCGMVIGHVLVSQAMPALLTRPVAIIQGVVFPAAVAAEPTTDPRAEGVAGRQGAPSVASNAVVPVVSTATYSQAASHRHAHSTGHDARHQGKQEAEQKAERKAGHRVGHARASLAASHHGRGWSVHSGSKHHGGHGHHRGSAHQATERETHHGRPDSGPMWRES